ncbi:bifunctional aconitate hydratase 2/2-methylisocitrate dehydratase [Desulfobotulus sp. H1]|uniref:Aconitate hydratase B n=1 Tax=Desulfobotulus pelophilus TaxID=2823377 RepID=A0ABT3N585_9BACT|nr:bifunctional aconitate hydratase 2/2-methylisocitrate dehydratase [Desulfobotulus pelophilus]MCW7752621.1 bifunctional aconitate hydratase 2/2-methylisocitrate dehydratase [Desulfobotulus pelophilus]
MISEYRGHMAERAAEGVPPLALSAAQAESLCVLLESPPEGEGEFLLSLMRERVSPGVDPAARVKADFLAGLAFGSKVSPLLSPSEAVELLGTMRGGYNVRHLMALLSHDIHGEAAAKALGKTLLVLDVFDEIAVMAEDLPNARRVLESWAWAEWFTARPVVPEIMDCIVFRVDGEINTDDFSPAGEAWSRPDIPLHAKSMLTSRMHNPLEMIEKLKEAGLPLAFVGDVVGTGSSRKSATNSLLWHIGEDIPFVPNKRQGGVVVGGKIAPIFFNTLEDSGALPIECDVSSLSMGQRIRIRPHEGRIEDENGKVLCDFTLKTPVLLDGVRAGGRIPLIVGRSLTAKAASAIGLKGAGSVFAESPQPEDSGRGYTQAQKIIGKACGLKGVRPGMYCEPVMTTVGSQDTTGPMTRDELTELACLTFGADLVMQSFCHTAAYPRPVDIRMHETLPDFIRERGGVALNPGDGVIHSWLNRMILPDTLGTGGDSHTRFPVGLSFPAGSGLVAFAAAMGAMPLDVPESVLVRFRGARKPGITLRDLVNAIPLAAIREGLLTVEKSGKKNIFSGRILEMEGLDDLEVEEAFELTDASAERSAAAGCIRLRPEKVAAYMRSSAVLLRRLAREGYGDARTLECRADAMDQWCASPWLLEADTDAEYAAVIEIDMDSISEPILACPNDPDDVRLLSDVAGTHLQEVFIGSCMTHIGHFRAAAALLEGKADLPVRLWVCPPTRMDADQLRREGLFSVLGRVGARMEMPGCSLCMGNQARIAPGVTALSTSTRNFPNRMGDGTQVFLASAELAAIAAALGELPDPVLYFRLMQERVTGKEKDLYHYLRFSEE